MNTMMTMNPWSFLDELLDTQSRVFRSMRDRAAGRFPPVNVYLDDTAVLIDIELPGKTAKDVDLTLEPQAVTIADKKVKGEEAKDEGEAVKDGDGGAPEWSRRIELPFRIDADKANAKFENGILRVELPKAEAQAVRKIEIK